ncbi:hypothetical protein LXL04_007134 [Taraxacum kok-saghyz]
MQYQVNKMSTDTEYQVGDIRNGKVAYLELPSRLPFIHVSKLKSAYGFPNHSFEISHQLNVELELLVQPVESKGVRTKEGGNATELEVLSTKRSFYLYLNTQTDTHHPSALTSGSTHPNCLIHYRMPTDVWLQHISEAQKIPDYPCNLTVAAYSVT